MKWAAVREHFDKDLLRLGRFGEPDERLHSFQLTEKETPIFPLFGIVPVFQQPPGDAGNTGIGMGGMLAPGLDARSNPVDQWYFNKPSGVIKRL